MLDWRNQNMNECLEGTYDHLGCVEQETSETS